MTTLPPEPLFPTDDPLPGYPSRLVLVRHASTPWTRSRQHTGRTDVELDYSGRLAAVELRVRLAPLRGARVLSSPLRRALDTCRLAGFADTVETSDLLLEWDYGVYEGLTTPEIQAIAPGWSLFRDGCPAGETAVDVGRRADELLEQLAADTSSATVVLFAHGHLLRVLSARWLGLAPGEGALFTLDAPSVSELGFERDRRVVHRWNT
jgi:probable phosphoglycerate mutase